MCALKHFKPMGNHCCDIFCMHHLRKREDDTTPVLFPSRSMSRRKTPTLCMKPKWIYLGQKCKLIWSILDTLGLDDIGVPSISWKTIPKLYAVLWTLHMEASSWISYSCLSRCHCDVDIFFCGLCDHPYFTSSLMWIQFLEVWGIIVWT